MKKSNFSVRAMFLWSVVAVGCAIAVLKVTAQSVVGGRGGICEGNGRLIAKLIQPVNPPKPVDCNHRELEIAVSVENFTQLDLCGPDNCKPQADGVTYPKAVISTKTPAVTDQPQKIEMSIPASAPVAYCASSGAIYDRRTGLCSDGNAPYKIVPLDSVSEPAAKTPNVICKAPMVPTFEPCTKKWQCIVPAGFKLNLGR